MHLLTFLCLIRSTWSGWEPVYSLSTVLFDIGRPIWWPIRAARPTTETLLKCSARSSHGLRADLAREKASGRRGQLVQVQLSYWHSYTDEWRAYKALLLALHHQLHASNCSFLCKKCGASVACLLGILHSQLPLNQLFIHRQAHVSISITRFNRV